MKAFCQCLDVELRSKLGGHCVRVTQETARRYIEQQRVEILRVREATDDDEDQVKQLDARVSPFSIISARRSLSVQ